MEKKKQILSRTALFAATLFWGSSFVILKDALESVSIFWILAVRFSIAALLFAGLAGNRLKSLDRASISGSVLIGLCLAAAYIVQTFGLKYTTPGKNAFLTATYCVLTPFLAWFIYKRRPTAANILAAFICLAGIGFVSLSSTEAGLNDGDILTLFSGLFYALQILAIERCVSDVDPLCISAVEFITAAAICWIGHLLFEAPPQALSPSIWLTILYLAVVCTGLCFFLEAWGIRYTPSSTAAVILTFEAVIGALCSVIFYHEKLTLRLFIGFALIFFSVILSELGPSFLKRRRSS